MTFAVRHIDCPVGEGDLFVTAQFERTVTLWSFQQRRAVATFDTVLDFGGTRLALVPGERPVVITAAYHKRGVAAYDARTGAISWQRKDLKHVQDVRWLAGAKASPQIEVGFDADPLLVLDTRSGITLTSFEGVREAWAHPYATLAVQVAKGSVKLCSLPEWTVLWEQPLRSFAVLSAAIGPSSLAFSEAGGPLRCFDFEGRCLWERTSDKGSHVLEVAWSEASGSWVAVEWPYETGGARVLLALDANGILINKRMLGMVSTCKLFAGGRYLVTSAGQVIDVETGQVGWEFL